MFTSDQLPEVMANALSPMREESARVWEAPRMLKVLQTNQEER